MAQNYTNIQRLVDNLMKYPIILTCAQIIANAVVQDPNNHCAATLSSLLIFGQIYPVGLNQGVNNIEVAVLNLVSKLQNIGFLKIDKNDPINKGDIGVIEIGATHHIYLILDATDQTNPLIADNRQPGFHNRPVAGNPDPTVNESPTSFFLRAVDK